MSGEEKIRIWLVIEGDRGVGAMVCSGHATLDDATAALQGRPVVSKGVQGGSMTRDEVMALTDEELRIRAAELAGVKRERLCKDDPGCVIPCIDGEEDVSDCIHLSQGGCWKDCDKAVQGNLPDYPNDIAAAWWLFDVLVKDLRHPQVSHLPVQDGNPYMCAWDESPWIEADTAPRAITRAFILAMTQEDSNES